MRAVDEPDELAETVVGQDADSDVIRPGHLQLVLIGSGTLATHPLPESGLITIGRSNRCDITIDDKSLSRRHAVLKIGERLTIEDLGSANGTRVRGNKIKLGQVAAIHVGELIGLGDANIIVQQRSVPLRPRRLWTHDYFEARLEEECAREQRSGAAFALLRIHADRRAPVAVVEETLCEVVRESDILGKYGPFEYEIILPDTPATNAEDAVRRLESKLVESGFKCRVFVACCPRDGRSPYQLAAKVQASSGNGKPATTPGGEIVVSDPQMQSLHRMIEQIADSHLCVLLLGETGVGKEVFARAVHRSSPRSTGPFVEINCAALTESLLESELFGHEKGAFTNAVAAKPGLIEIADGGTLLLDEIGDMPLATQAKLLRVIEDSQLRRVGGLKSKPIDVRFVAATNNNLEDQIAGGLFRRDLYYRLNGVTIVIPPLRERLAELEPLAKMFIERVRSRDGGQGPKLSREALDAMKSYSWPGNVRELKNTIERAVLLSGGGPITPEHLPNERMVATTIVPGQGTRPPPLERGSDQERAWILQALDRTGGNQTQAARLLGISRRTLVNRLNEYKQVHRPRKNKPTRSPKD